MSKTEKKQTKRKRPRKPLAEEGKPGRYDKRNKLNDLTGKEWILLTKSYWMSEPSTDDKTAYAHPAPFMVNDVKKLISMFTKKGMTVLDPFAGSGTSLLAANYLDRKAIGIDLNPEFKEITVKRLNEKGCSDYSYLVGDSNDLLNNVETVDYIVTSPPYHNILRNKSKGTRHHNGKNYRMGARDGVEYYSDLENDLGNYDEYDDFIEALRQIMQKAFEKLKDGKYCSIIISDFTVNKIEFCVQSDIYRMMIGIGFIFNGTTALLQNVKPLYPFGYPYAYKINHHHQNIMTFRRPKPKVEKKKSKKSK